MSGNEHKKLLGNRVTTLKERARHLITIAMSAAGLTPLRQILAGLPADLPAAVIVLQHIGDHSELPLILRESTSMQTKFADRDELLYSGIVYVCPPLVHAVVRPTRCNTMITQLMSRPRRRSVYFDRARTGSWSLLRRVSESAPPPSS